MMGLIKNRTSQYGLDNRGFSLVEIIICVLILGVAVGPLMKALSMSAQTNGKAQKMQNATSLAEEIMEEVKGSSIADLEKLYNGTDTNGNPLEANLSVTEASLWASGQGAYDRVANVKSDASTYINATGTKKGALLKGIVGGADGSDTTPYYVLYIPDETATQGQTFDVTVSFRSSPYKSDALDTLNLADSSTTNDYNVSGANYVKLPKIEEIDPLTQAVITGKELTKYDSAALNFFKEKLADTSSGTAPTLSTKTITIRKEDAVGWTTAVKVSCNVSYTSSDASLGTYSRDIFTGTYSQQDKEVVDEATGTTSTEYVDMNSGIYIFYKAISASVQSPSTLTEQFVIEDASTIGTSGEKHKVYFVKQDEASTGAPPITYRTYQKSDIAKTLEEDTAKTQLGEILYTDYSDLDAEGCMYANTEGTANYMQLITNLKDGGNKGHIYKSDSSVRLYEITVELTRDGDAENTVFATLTSTDNAKK